MIDSEKIPLLKPVVVGYRDYFFLMGICWQIIYVACSEGFLLYNVAWHKICFFVVVLFFSFFFAKPYSIFTILDAIEITDNAW